MTKYTMHSRAGVHFNFEERTRAAALWNARIKHGPQPTLRSFAEEIGVPYETWRREYNRGKTAETVPDSKRPGRKIYAEYDPGKAQDAVNDNAKGARMLVTNVLEKRFAHYVKELRLSPNDAVHKLREEFPDKRIPKVSTWYNHIRIGDISVKYGETPYRPNRRRKRRDEPHPARTVPGRRQLSDRPAAANLRSEQGHWEMDTVVSCVGGKGGLLVMIDRMTRVYRVEKIDSVSQDGVVKAVRRLLKRKALGEIASVTADNGCEFLDDKKLERLFGCRVYYTRAYASYEKGSVENCNRIVRRWHPKGTDFGKMSRAEARSLERTINGIHRASLGGMTADEFAASLRAA